MSCPRPIEDPEARVHFLCAVSVASLRRLLGPDFDKHIKIEGLNAYAHTHGEQMELVFTAAPPAGTFYVKEFKIE